MTRAMHLYFRVAGSEAEASALASEDMSNRTGRSMQVLPHQAAIGTVDDCLRAVERFISCGIEHFCVQPGVQKARVHEPNRDICHGDNAPVQVVPG